MSFIKAYMERAEIKITRNSDKADTTHGPHDVSSVTCWVHGTLPLLSGGNWDFRPQATSQVQDPISQPDKLLSRELSPAREQSDFSIHVDLIWTALHAHCLG